MRVTLPPKMGKVDLGEQLLLQQLFFQAYSHQASSKTWNPRVLQGSQSLKDEGFRAQSTQVDGFGQIYSRHK